MLPAADLLKDSEPEAEPATAEGGMPLTSGGGNRYTVRSDGEAVRSICS